MAPFVPVPNAVHVELRMRLEGQLIENTLSFFNSDGWDAGLMQDLGVDLIEWWDTQYSQYCHQSLTLVEVYITDLTTQTSPTHTVVPSQTTVGKITQSEALPANVSLAVSFRSALRGRSARGRNFVAGLAEGYSTGSTIAPAAVSSFVAAYNGLLALASNIQVVWCIVSRFSGGQPRTAGEVYPVIAALVTDNVADSQRRRLPGRGR